MGNLLYWAVVFLIGGDRALHRCLNWRTDETGRRLVAPGNACRQRWECAAGSLR
jgi:hypothetical protein